MLRTQVHSKRKILSFILNLKFCIVLPCLVQSLAVPLVLGRGPNEKSEQKPREAEEERVTQSQPSSCQELLSQL